MCRWLPLSALLWVVTSACGSKPTDSQALRRLMYEMEFVCVSLEAAAGDASSGSCEELASRLGALTADPVFASSAGIEPIVPDAPDFSALRDDLVDRTSQLAATAAARDGDRTRAALKDVRQSCDACHVAYRTPGRFE